MPSLAICTAWRDHLELADDYFQAVDAANPDQLVIVDDASEQPLPFAQVRLDEPSGFCTGNNAGVRLAETDFVLLLNNDIRMLRPDWCDDIRRWMERGVLLGPIRYDPHGHVDDTPYPYVDGWCAAIAASDLAMLGGLDERYDQAGPAYYSDNHLSLVARANGMRLRDLKPGLFHKGGQTGGQDRAAFENALKANGELFTREVSLRGRKRGAARRDLA